MSGDTGLKDANLGSTIFPLKGSEQNAFSHLLLSSLQTPGT